MGEKETPPPGDTHQDLVERVNAANDEIFENTVRGNEVLSPEMAEKVKLMLDEPRVKVLARMCWAKIERLLYYRQPGPPEEMCTFIMSAIQGTIEEALAESKGTLREESKAIHERVAREIVLSLMGRAQEADLLGVHDTFETVYPGVTEILRRKYGKHVQLSRLVSEHANKANSLEGDIVLLKAKLAKARRFIASIRCTCGQYSRMPTLDKCERCETLKEIGDV